MVLNGSAKVPSPPRRAADSDTPRAGPIPVSGSAITIADPAPLPEALGYIRIIVGMVVGLSLARLVNGLTRFIQHPTNRVYLIHFAWTLFMLSAIVHFWWYQFSLNRVHVWTFGLYLFVLVYAMLFVGIASLLFPDSMDEYTGYEDYFESRRRWFYGLLAAIFVVDIGNTLIKGTDFFLALGVQYPIRQVLLAVGAVIAIFVSSRKYQVFFVTLALVHQFIWIFRHFDVLQ